jgi:hypothetical protein
MLMDPGLHGKFFGRFAAMDGKGRSASYDPTVTQPESLAECLFRNIPLGMTPEETVARHYAMESRRRKSALVNFGVFLWASVILVLLTSCRVWLMWERARAHRRHRKADAERGAVEGGAT